MAAIPAYNEEKSIARIVLESRRHVDRVIVCDDGSNDVTGQIAESLGALVIRHSKNLGKGAAIRTLFDVSMKLGASMVITLDADGQHDPHDIPPVVRPIIDGIADISIGSRLSYKNYIPTHRRIGNKVLDFLTNLRTVSKLADTQSGFRAYSKKAIEEIEIRDNGIGVDSQILLSARDKNLRVAECQISVNYEGDTSTFNPIRHFSAVVYAIIKYSVQKRPLLLIGLPGLIVLGIGLTYGMLLLSIYTNLHEFILAYALLAVGGTLLGTLAILVALVLFALSELIARFKSPGSGVSVILSSPKEVQILPRDEFEGVEPKRRVLR